jgi:hypothetical protein
MSTVSIFSGSVEGEDEAEQRGPIEPGKVRMIVRVGKRIGVSCCGSLERVLKAS